MMLSKRLSAVLSYVDRNARLLDVGTDHAFLPIELILNKTVDKAWASDVNEGPLRSAAENAARYGVADRLTLYLSDGLKDCRCFENRYDVIVIAGMGGQTIAEIIEKSDYVKKAAPTLILQPMTMQYELRSFLSSNGFGIHSDSVISDAGKFYTLIVCKYTGIPYEINEKELTFGRFFDDSVKNAPVFREYLRFQSDVFSKISKGKKAGGLNTDFEDSSIECIRDALSAFDEEDKNDDI